MLALLVRASKWCSGTVAHRVILNQMLQHLLSEPAPEAGVSVCLEIGGKDIFLPRRSSGGIEKSR